MNYMTLLFRALSTVAATARSMAWPSIPDCWHGVCEANIAGALAILPLLFEGEPVGIYIQPDVHADMAAPVTRAQFCSTKTHYATVSGVTTTTFTIYTTEVIEPGYTTYFTRAPGKALLRFTYHTAHDAQSL